MPMAAAARRRDRFPLEAYQLRRGNNVHKRWPAHGHGQPLMSSPLLSMDPLLNPNIDGESKEPCETRPRRSGTAGVCPGFWTLFLFLLCCLQAMVIIHGLGMSDHFRRSIFAKFAEAEMLQVLHPFALWNTNVTQDIDLIKSHLNLNLQRDFALGANGARIIPEITSAIYSGSSRAIYDLFTRPSEPRRKPYKPSIILESQVVIGECWEIDGVNGHVGILLSQPVKMTEMTISYPYRQLISRYDIGRAPRNFILWALQDSSSFGPFQPSYPSHLVSTFATTKRLPDIINPSARFVPIVNGTYNTTTAPQVQHFGLMGLHLNFAVEIVVLEIVDNWESNTTCVYPVTIHGDPA